LLEHMAQLSAADVDISKASNNSGN
jgi:hypothetical protein